MEAHDWPPLKGTPPKKEKIKVDHRLYFFTVSLHIFSAPEHNSTVVTFAVEIPQICSGLHCLHHKTEKKRRRRRKQKKYWPCGASIRGSLTSDRKYRNVFLRLGSLGLDQQL